MFVKQTFSSFVLFVGGSLLLTLCVPGEPWQKYSGSVTGGKENSFYHRMSGNNMCFVGRRTDDSMFATYAGYYNTETAELRVYAVVHKLKPSSVKSIRIEATEINASINQPEDPAALANLMLADNSLLESKISGALVPAPIKNGFTESECWNGEVGLPLWLGELIKDRF